MSGMGLGADHLLHAQPYHETARRSAFLGTLSFNPSKKAAILTSAFLRTPSTTTRDRNLQFRGAFSTGFFLNFLHAVDFSPFSRFSVQFRKEITPNVDKIARFQAGENVQIPMTSLAVMFFFFVFFGPDFQASAQGADQAAIFQKRLVMWFACLNAYHSILNNYRQRFVLKTSDVHLQRKESCS